SGPSMSKTRRPRVWTPTLAPGLRDHHLRIVAASVVARSGQRWMAGVFVPGSSGKTGQPWAARARAASGGDMVGQGEAGPHGLAEREAAPWVLSVVNERGSGSVSAPALRLPQTGG